MMVLLYNFQFPEDLILLSVKYASIRARNVEKNWAFLPSKRIWFMRIHKDRISDHSLSDGCHENRQGFQRFAHFHANIIATFWDIF